MATKKDALAALAAALEKFGWEIRDYEWQCGNCGLSSRYVNCCARCGRTMAKRAINKSPWRRQLMAALKAYAAAGGKLPKGGE